MAPSKSEIWLQPKPLELFHMIEAAGIGVPTRIGYGGSRGGGKSRSARDIMLLRRTTHPGTKGVLFRRVWDDLKVNHVDKFFEEHPDLREYYSVSDHEIRLPNKSVIKFMYAETSAEISRKFWGPEFMDLFADQAEQLSGEEIQQMSTAIRDPKAAPGMCKMVLFFNPGGIGTAYLRRVFWLKQYLHNENPEDYAFIQAYGWDNYEWLRMSGTEISERGYYSDLTDDQRFHLFISKTQYGRDLNALPPSLRAGHLLGSFESFEGQYYAGVWDESKCVITMSEAAILAEPWWVRWKACDWGFAHYSAVLWFFTGRASIDKLKALGIKSDIPLDVVVVCREYVANEIDEIELGEKIATMTPEDERHVDRHMFLSPDAKQKKSSANTIKEQIASVMKLEGLPEPEDADNQRVAGWRLIYNCLKTTCMLRFRNEVVTEPVPFPILLVSAACPEVISSMPLLIRDKEHDMEDVLKTDDKSDDVGDTLRYGLKSYFAPRVKAPREVRALEVAEKFKDNPTGKAMALRIFNEAERKRSTRNARGLRR